VIETIWILMAFIVFVLTFNYVRLGSIVGLFVAGALIGPHGFGFVRHIYVIDFLAELGIMFLLFSIGLELKIDRFRLYGWRVYGLAIAQLVVTTGALALIASALGLSPLAAIIVAGALTFSSTALVLQILHDLGRTVTVLGRLAVAILLIQDIAVGFFLVGLESLGPTDDSVFAIPLLIGQLVLSIAVLVAVGRLALPVILRVVSEHGNQETFLATVLIVVLASSVALEQAGASTAIGAFLAGLLVADTAYRHQIAADIAPFRQLLLGIFFMAVGMGTNLTLASNHIVEVFAIAAGLVAAKAVIVAVLAVMFGHPLRRGAELGLLLSEGSEFTFIIVTVAVVAGLIPPLAANILAVAVAVSMALVAIAASVARPVLNRIEGEAKSSEAELRLATSELSDHIIVVGFGQVGLALSRHLVSLHLPILAVDYSAARVQKVHRPGVPVYFGNALRSEVLHSCGLGNARLAIIALPDAEVAQRVLELMLRLYPGKDVLVRAQDERQAGDLIKAGARGVVLDGLTTALDLAERAVLMYETGTVPPAATSTHPAE
jgi:CPA2 family monovalent cation:H+ antiporter-2